MINKESAQFWQTVTPDSIITLSDEQTISDSIDRGEGLASRDYKVESIWTITASDNIAKWILFKLDDDDQEIFLVAKIVDSVFNLYVFFQPEEFESGNRKDLIDRGEAWLFMEPEDPDDFEFDELEFVNKLILNDQDEEGEEIEIPYKLKGQGVIFGSCTHSPAMSGISAMMAVMVEYSALKPSHNPEVMILEIGGSKGNEGGLISMLMGCPITLSEIEVLINLEEKPVVRPKLSVWEKILKKASK